MVYTRNNLDTDAQKFSSAKAFLFLQSNVDKSYILLSLNPKA